MARKKTTESPSNPPAVKPRTPVPERPSPPAGKAGNAAKTADKPLGRRKPAAEVSPGKAPAGRKKEAAAPKPVPAVQAAAPEVKAGPKEESGDGKKRLEALDRHTHDAALQLAALRHQVQTLGQELEQTRRELLHETEQLGEARQQAQALREAVREASGQFQGLTRDLEETRAGLRAMRQETQELAGQPAALRAQAVAVAGELEETRRHVLLEMEQLAEVRGQAQAVRSGLQQAEEEAAGFGRRFAESEARLTEQMATHAQRIEMEYAEAMGRLQALRRETEAAAEQAAALGSQSRAAAAEIAETAAELRETLQEAAEEATEYANASALLGAEGDNSDDQSLDTPAPDSKLSPPVHEPMQLGVVVAADSATVLEVEADSPAARAGVEQGDVITSVNDKTVQNGEDLREIVSHLGDVREVVIRLERAGRPEEVRAHLPEIAPAAPA